MRYLTNDYRDAQILDLGSKGQLGPYLVTQTGCSRTATVPKTHMFVLRPDGQWVDFNAYACQRKPELMDELVFASVSDVMNRFGQLRGTPRVLDLPVDETGLSAWLQQQEGGNPLEAARAWAVKYRERRAGNA
jgi:hypothetical protein